MTFNRSTMNFLIYMRKVLFSFYQCKTLLTNPFEKYTSKKRVVENTVVPDSTCSTYWRIVWVVVNPQLDSCKHNNTLCGNFYYIQALLNCLLEK
jgi:hypothetical protein